MKYMNKMMDEQLLYGATGYLPAGMGVHTGNGVVTFPPHVESEPVTSSFKRVGGVSSSPSSITKSVSPERRSWEADADMQGMEPSVAGSSVMRDYRTSASQFLEKYGHYAQGVTTAVTESGVSSMVYATVTPDDPVAVRRSYPPSGASAAPLYPHLEGSAAKRATTSSLAGHSIGLSSTSTNDLRPYVLHETEEQMLREVGIDITQFHGYNQTDDDDVEIDDLSYYSTSKNISNR